VLIEPMTTKLSAGRLHRLLTAVILVLAIGGVPLLLDHCAATCELARTPVSAAVAPACHHSAQGPAVGHTREACGHDPDGTGTLSVPSRVDSSVSPLVAALHLASIVFDLEPPQHARAASTAASPPDLPAPRMLSPLRI
jgi:hypothetical protein